MVNIHRPSFFERFDKLSRIGYYSKVSTLTEVKELIERLYILVILTSFSGTVHEIAWLSLKSLNSFYTKFSVCAENHREFETNLQKMAINIFKSVKTNQYKCCINKFPWKENRICKSNSFIVSFVTTSVAMNLCYLNCYPTYLSRNDRL